MTIIIAQFTLAFIRSRIESTDLTVELYHEFIRIWGIFCQQGITEGESLDSRVLPLQWSSIFYMKNQAPNIIPFLRISTVYVAKVSILYRTCYRYSAIRRLFRVYDILCNSLRS